VQGFYDFIKSEQDYSGEEIQFKRAA